jgi:hypothetical protein
MNTLSPTINTMGHFVAQTFLSAGSRDIPVPYFWLATGKPEPAGWKACATSHFDNPSATAHHGISS